MILNHLGGGVHTAADEGGRDSSAPRGEYLRMGLILHIPRNPEITTLSSSIPLLGGEVVDEAASQSIPDQLCSVVRTAWKNGQPYTVHEMVQGSSSDFKCFTKSFQDFSVNTRDEKVKWLTICPMTAAYSSVYVFIQW